MDGHTKGGRMKLDNKSHKKLRELSETALAKELGVSMQLCQYWQKTGNVHDMHILGLREAVDFPIEGEWKEGERSMCETCNCVRICSK